MNTLGMLLGQGGRWSSDCGRYGNQAEALGSLWQPRVFELGMGR